MAVKMVDIFGNVRIEGRSEGYGIPYMGSKRAIAVEVMQAIYDTVGDFDRFYDPFGGGGAMSFMALEMGISEIYYNELNAGIANLMIQLRDVGIPPEWYNFVNRETFFEHQDKDTAYAGMIKSCYSFGSSQTTYLYGMDIQDVKETAHEYIVNKDLNAKYKLEAEFEVKIPKLTGGLHNRRRQLGRFVKRSQSDEIQVLTQAQHLERLHLIERIQHLTSIQQLENLSRLQHLERINGLEKQGGFRNMKITNLSYEEVEIKPGAVIYCDIPYEDTATYQEDGFDHRKFEQWFINNPNPVFVSSYNFNYGKVVMEVEKTVSLQGGGGSTAVERMYWNGVTLDM